MKFSVAQTQTLENVARKISPKFHAKFHDIFGGEKRRKFSLPHFCRVAALTFWRMYPTFRCHVPGEHANVPSFRFSFLGNVPSFRFSFRGNIRQNHPFGNHPFVNPRHQARKNNTKINYLVAETARWGGGLPREGVVAEEFAPSLESLSSLALEENLGCPGNFAGMSRTPGGAQNSLCAKKSMRAFFVSYPKGCQNGSVSGIKMASFLEFFDPEDLQSGFGVNFLDLVRRNSGKIVCEFLSEF